MFVWQFQKSDSEVCENQMRMGCRSSEKAKMKCKKGLWSPEEDQRLRDYILKHGHGCWTEVPVKAGLERNGKSCRLRWINYLRPGIKRGRFSHEEEELTMKLHTMLGNKWSQIAMHLPGRTDNEVKNYWNTYLKKRVKQSEESESAKFAENPSSDSSAQNHKNREAALCKSSKSSIFDSLDHSESSSHSHGHPQERLQNPWPPKVMFADWIFGENSDGLNWDSCSFESREKLINGDLRPACHQEFGGGGGYTSCFEPVDLAGNDSFDLLSFEGSFGGFEMDQDLMF